MNTPLFVADVEELQKRLRLTGVTFEKDTYAMLEEAILTVRAGFYRRLGPARVAQLVALPYVEDPTDEDGTLRAIANTTEVTWVRLHLVRRMPTLFADSSNEKFQEWNDNPYLRGLVPQREIDRMSSEIEQNLEMLTGDESLGEESSVQATTFGPETDPPLPFDTLDLKI